MDGIEALENLVLRKLRNGPKHAASFKGYSVIIDKLVKSGKVVRVSGVGNKARNMIMLQEKGDD